MEDWSDISKKMLSILLFTLTLELLVIILTAFGPGSPTIPQCFIAFATFTFGFFPAFLYVSKKESGIPFLPVFGVVYTIYYALPIFILKKYTIGLVRPSADSLSKALSLAALGLFILLIAYYKIPGRHISRFVPKISIYWDLSKAKFWAVIFCILGVAANFLLLVVNVPVQFAQIGLFLSDLLIIGIGILFILQLQGRLDRIGKALLWVVFLPSIFLLELASGSIAPILLTIIFLSFTYWCFARKIPWKPAIIMVLLLVFLSSAKNEFRNLSWRGTSSGKNPIEKSMLFIKIAFTKGDAFNKGCNIAAGRTAHNLLSFAHVLDLTPKIVPYWMGNSYRALLWAPIPRVVFPWKPAITLGQEFGHRYGFLQTHDKATSWNLPQLVEMYANFGIAGIIFGMFIMGIIYRLFYEMFCHPNAGEGGALIGIFVFTRLTNIESDFSRVFGNIVYYIILLIIISSLMKGSGTGQCPKK